MWLHSLKVAQLLRSAACLHTNQSRSYLNHLVFGVPVSGQFLTELERHAEAAAQYVRAVELAPAQYDLVLSAATALRHAGHAQHAENFYRRAAELKPQVTDVLMQSAT